MSRPFVIAVASEKGGVGKTTIATNLAVYLKALREDLPVTIASFDNHFSVDQMFALGAKPELGVEALLDDEMPVELTSLGQYGVQYIASARRLQPPAHAPEWLRPRLYSAAPEGLLILDTRPILDWFTEAALLAADLVLVPIKDRAALINAAALRQVMADAGCADRLWMLPSLVDSRARLNAEVRVHEFLAYAAKERDYQVLDIHISKSPKVEGLASGFSSAIRPVLTHARNTAVHGQLKALAEYVLKDFDAGTHDRVGSPVAAETTHDRRLLEECPVCCQNSQAVPGHFFFDFGSRRRGLIHSDCLTDIYEEIGFEDADEGGDSLALTIDGPGLVDLECRLTRHCCDREGTVLSSEGVLLEGCNLLHGALAAMTGRSLDEAYRELIIITRDADVSVEQMTGEKYSAFVTKRRKIAKELRGAGLF